MVTRPILWSACALVLLGGATSGAELDPAVVAVLRSRCVKCHGPIKREGGLDLSSPARIARGGEQGPVVVPHDLEASLLWRRVVAGEMPPKEELGANDRDVLEQWIQRGAAGLPATNDKLDMADHWAFRPLVAVPLPSTAAGSAARAPLDQLVEFRLLARERRLLPEAERRVLLRRVSLLATGLPPSIEDGVEFLGDERPDAHEQMVERYLASPRYGERWGKIWLDAAGYADSNGYFGADTDRPLAYRYRDYVIRCVNEDRNWDQFVREQLAGDELAEFKPGQPASERTIELLEATHYLRNGPDGTSESDGNPDEVRVDRYAALEACLQNVGASLLGLTVQCAKCHEHKFEPLDQREYYALQSIFYPVFPAGHADAWVKPKDRWVEANLPGVKEAWETRRKSVEERLAAARTQLRDWLRQNRLRGEVLFEDPFAGPSLATTWSAIAPGDDKPGGVVPVGIDREAAPAARIAAGQLQVIEGNTQGDSWLSTAKAWDWSPDLIGEAIQVTFDLVRDRLNEQGAAAYRIGFLLGLHDFDDNSAVSGGNVLIDGNPAGGASVHFDYPGTDSRGGGKIGTSGFAPGHNFGVRLTRLDKEQLRMELVVDGVPEQPAIECTSNDLPPGGFGFEYCCGRSFVIDNVLIERFPPPNEDPKGEQARFRAELAARRQVVEEAEKELAVVDSLRPGRIAWASATAEQPPETRFLVRGNYGEATDSIAPAAPRFLADSSETSLSPSRRRLAFAEWVTRPGSRAAALLARVHVNRIWQHCFGEGLAATPENLGLSGSVPAAPEVVDYLAGELVRSGWSSKHVHRLILNSATFRQANRATQDQSADIGAAATPATAEPIPLAGFRSFRLDAESIRDGMLAAAGDLDLRMYGPYVPTQRTGSGEVVVPEGEAGARRRSVYLQQRRTQVTTLLQVFDAPSIVFHSVRRPRSTMPLQSLSLLNSEFALARSQSLAQWVTRASAAEADRIRLVFKVVLGRDPAADEVRNADEFRRQLVADYRDRPQAEDRAWRDFCQSLLICNEALYVE